MFAKRFHLDGLGYIACGVVAAGLRLPFISTGVSMDEGGYAYVAQQWSRGARLYDTVWIDRPQGFLLTYRFLLGLGDGAWTIRLGAVLAGAAITVLLGLVGGLLFGRTVGLATAAIYAVVGVAPHIEGFTFNGELAASLPATAAAAAALWWRRVRASGWLFAAGLAAGTAVTMKQSGIDGIVVGLAAVVVSPPRRMRNVGMFLGGVALPMAASSLHGALMGWGRYWQALAGYQLDAAGNRESGLPARWGAFVHNLPTAGSDLALLTVGAILGLWALRRRRDVLGITAAWLFAAGVGVNLGGSYWPHYYVQAVPPLVLGSVAGIVALKRKLWRASAVLALTAPTLVWLVALIPASAQEREHAVPYHERALRDERIATAIARQTRPTDRIFIVESEANIYWLAQRSSAYPYIWGKPIEKIPNAVAQLQHTLASTHRPALVGVQTPPEDIDRSGTVGRLLATHYRPAQTIEGMTLHVRRN
jgi:4-amino-4-deoxy-L-arabinose transferase-like glycosyltransferase